MKKLIYVNGHFYNTLTNERVKIKEETEITVLTADTISKAEKIGKHHKILTPDQQKGKIKSDPNVSAFKKALDKGTKLYFSIPHYSSHLNDNVNHEFEVELLEDLYFYMKKNAKKDESRLYNCACVVKRNTTKTIKMFEEVLGKSLNQVYKNTYVHYFGNEGNPSCNAIDRFYEESGKEKNAINRYRVIDDNKEEKNLFNN